MVHLRERAKKAAQVQVVEKRVEVPVEVIKTVEKRVEVPVEVVKVDNRRIYELEEELRKHRIMIEEWRSKYISIESRGPQIVEKVIEKRVEVPIEVVKVDNRRIYELEEELRKHRSMIEEWRSKYISIESRGPQIVEKVIEKRVEVPIEVVKVDNRRIYELEEELRKHRSLVEEWRSKFITIESRGPQIVEKVVEKRVEVPIEVVKVDNRRIYELEEELRKHRTIIEEWRSKYISLESRGPQIVEKIVEKRVEVPVEVR